MQNYTKNDNQFYPTPNELIERMLTKINMDQIKTILEPSAGDGRIVNYINDSETNKNRYPHNKLDIDCIEKDDNLIHILKGNKLRVIHNDFLNFNTFKRYDLIIMNPPFTDGDEHLLKALELQKNGGKIVCLLNAETIKNPYSNKRKDLIIKLNKYDAEIEYINNAFSFADRKTDIEIALIYIDIPKVEKESYIFNQLKQEQKFNEVEQDEVYSIISNDFVREIVKQYDLEVKAGIRLIEEYTAMTPYIMSDFKESYYNKPILKLDFPDTRDYSENLSINEYIIRVRRKYWSSLFGNNKFTELFTNDLRQQYLEQVEELINYDFSEYNVLQIRIEMSKNVSNGIEDAMTKLFDDFSHTHSYYQNSDNIHYYNGWKTNKAWYINKKVIIPLSAYDDWDKRLRVDANKIKYKMADIEKVFDYLRGELNSNFQSISDILETAQKEGKSKKIEFKYFIITFYKKGTCHIEFKDLELLKKFNIYGSQKKGWLPPSYGKKHYNSMTEEEKTVIDDFQGKEDYEKVYINQEYYIVKTNDMLMLDLAI